MDRKVCQECGTVKPLAEFYRHMHREAGRDNRCKNCCAKQKRTPKLPPPPPGTKRCTLCKEIKPITDFTVNRTRADGRHYTCKACLAPKYAAYREVAKEKIRAKARQRYWKDPERSRDYHLSYHYRIRPGTYADMLAKQGGVCAICGRVDNPGKTRFAIDHCHDSKKICGLLCTCCNQGIGQFLNSPEILRRAADYCEATRAVVP